MMEMCLKLFISVSTELNIEMWQVIVVHTVVFSLETGFDSEEQSP